MGLFKFLEEKFSKKADDKENSSRATYIEGMEKSRKNFIGKLSNLTKKYKKVNSEYFEALEEILIEADVGVDLTFKVIEKTLEESKSQKIYDPEKINELLVSIMFENYMKGEESIQNDIVFDKNSLTVLLVVGVNGVGKTTTIAKLAYRYINQGKKVMFGACDTFRAGAVEQLSIWADRLNISIVKGKENEDPSSVAFRSVDEAIRQGVDLLIVDTAGRLQTKDNLMNELAKIKRVIAKRIENAPQETFLIIDATTGQNGVNQARAFKDATSLTGICITKMDGTSKGGIILAIKDELNVPVRFIGLGEKMEDLEEFDLDKYLYGLCIGDTNEK